MRPRNSKLTAAVAAEIRELIELFYHKDSYELAMKVGASRQSVSSWMCSRNLPSAGRLATLIALCERHGLPATAMREALGEGRSYAKKVNKRPVGTAIARFDERLAKCILRVGPSGEPVMTPGGRRLPLDREKLLGITSLCLDCRRPPGECSFFCLRVLPAGAEFFSFSTSQNDACFYKITHCPRFQAPEGFGDPEKRRIYLSAILGGIHDEEEEKKKRCV